MIRHLSAPPTHPTGLQVALLALLLLSTGAEAREVIPKVGSWPMQSSLRAVRHRAGADFRDSLKRHSATLRRRGLDNGQIDRTNKRFLRRYAGRLLREAGRLNGSLLPRTLPVLPGTDNRAIQQVIDRGKARSRTPKELYLYLEGAASRYRGSADKAQRELGKSIVSYLSGYKQSWAGAWIDGLYDRPLLPGRVGWRPKVTFRTRGKPEDLQFLPRYWPSQADTPPAVQKLFDAGKARTSDNKELYVHLEKKVGELRRSNRRDEAKQLRAFLDKYRYDWLAESRGTMKKRVAEAWGIIRRAVSPELLGRIPPVRVEVSQLYSTPCIVLQDDGSRTINLTTQSTVKDILHEFGHLIEDYGGRRPFAAAHALMTQRAYGGKAAWLGKLIPRTNYRKAARAFEGGFIDPYMGRRYQQGWTEIFSMALERMDSRERAREFFEQDGYHFLLFNQAVSRKGR
jgi:hypothetical protein